MREILIELLNIEIKYTDESKHNIDLDHHEFKCDQFEYCCKRNHHRDTYQHQDLEKINYI